MSFHYEVIEENGDFYDELTDLLHHSRIRIKREGAEMVSLARNNEAGNWQGFLYRDGITTKPASGWANHATVMGYFTHRLFNEQSTYRGHTIHGGTHGFLRHVKFEVPENHPQEDGRLIYRLSSDRIPKDAYPYKVSMQLTYKLAGEWVEVEFLFNNEERDREAHLSFGMHPGFAVSSIQNFRFQMPAGTYELFETVGNFLNGKTQEIEHEGGGMPFSRVALEGSYLLGIQKLKNRHFILEDAVLGHKIEMDYSQVPYITLWSDGNLFFCVEPCWGVPDNDPPVPFEQKTGIQTIAPGGALKKSFRLRPGFLIK